MRPGDEQTPGCARSCGHRHLVQEYRDQRDAWERLRESDTPVVGAPGTGDTVVSAMQLDDATFRDLFPPPTFRDFLVGRQNPTQ